MTNKIQQANFESDEAYKLYQNIWIPQRGPKGKLLLNSKTRKVKIVNGESGLAKNSYFPERTWEKIQEGIDLANSEANVLAPFFRTSTMYDGSLEFEDLLYHRVQMNGPVDAQTAMDTDTENIVTAHDFIQKDHPVVISWLTIKNGMRTWGNRQRGNAIPGIVEQMLLSIRQTNDKMILFGARVNGSQLVFEGKTSYGLTNSPLGTIVTTVAGLGTGGWDTALTNIQPTVLAMKRTLDVLNNSGPYTFFVNKTEWNTMQEAFPTDQSDLPIDQVEKIKDLTTVATTGYLAVGQGVLWSNASTKVKLVEHMPPMATEWRSNDGSQIGITTMSVNGMAVDADKDGNAVSILVTDLNT